MSKNKNLLNESQIRQFMKLASLEPLVPGFVSGLTERTSEDIEESHGRGRNEGAAGYGSPGAHSRLEELDDIDGLEGDVEQDLDDDSLEGDVEAMADEEEMAAEPEVAAEDQMINVQDLMTAITAALEKVTGQPVESEIEDADIEDEEELDADLDAAASVEADPEMGMDDDMLEETDASKIDEDDEGKSGKNESNKATDELVEQITKRVAARILKSALAKK